MEESEEERKKSNLRRFCRQMSRDHQIKREELSYEIRALKYYWKQVEKPSFLAHNKIKHLERTRDYHKAMIYLFEYLENDSGIEKSNDAKANIFLNSAEDYFEKNN